MQKGRAMQTNRTLYRCVIAVVVLLGSLVWAANSNEQADIEKRLTASGKVLDEIMSQPPDKASLYGSPIPLGDILSGKTQDPSVAEPFVSKVATYAG
jgi:hypothetical protein